MRSSIVDINAGFSNREPRTFIGPIANGPPINPVDKDIWVATAIDSGGTRWQFQYNAGSSSVYKWEFIGGASGMAVINQPGVTQVLNAGTQVQSTGYYYRNISAFSYVNVARGGDYEVQGNALLGFTSNASCWLAAKAFGQQIGGDVVGQGEPVYSFNDATISAGGLMGHQINDIVLATIAGGRVGFIASSSIPANAGFYGWNIKVRPVRIA